MGDAGDGTDQAAEGTDEVNTMNRVSLNPLTLMPMIISGNKNTTTPKIKLYISVL